MLSTASIVRAAAQAGYTLTTGQALLIIVCVMGKVIDGEDLVDAVVECIRSCS